MSIVTRVNGKWSLTPCKTLPGRAGGYTAVGQTQPTEPRDVTRVWDAAGHHPDDGRDIVMQHGEAVCLAAWEKDGFDDLDSPEPKLDDFIGDDVALTLVPRGWVRLAVVPV